MHAQDADAATRPDLQKLLQTSRRRSQLETDGSAPFLLKASFEWYSGKKLLGKGTLEQLWKDSHHYRQLITLPDKTLLEVDNGSQAWRTGEWSFPAEIGFGERSALQPFVELPESSVRFSLQPASSLNAELDCIDTEPEIPGVSPGTLLPQTTFCLQKGNHLLRRISRPNGWTIAFNQIESFGDRHIARSIDVFHRDGTLLRLHVDSLATSEDFSSLDQPPPTSAQLLQFHRADRPFTTTEIMRGSLLQPAAPILSGSGPSGEVRVKVHINEEGRVESVQVLDSLSKTAESEAVLAIKQWRFGASYQNGHLVPVDTIVTVRFAGRF